MYNVDYDSVLSCYCLHYQGEVVCLGAQTLDDAQEEANIVINSWQ